MKDLYYTRLMFSAINEICYNAGVQEGDLESSISETKRLTNELRVACASEHNRVTLATFRDYLIDGYPKDGAIDARNHISFLITRGRKE